MLQSTSRSFLFTYTHQETFLSLIVILSTLGGADKTLDSEGEQEDVLCIQEKNA